MKAGEGGGGRETGCQANGMLVISMASTTHDPWKPTDRKSTWTDMKSRYVKRRGYIEEVRYLLVTHNVHDRSFGLRIKGSNSLARVLCGCEY